MRAWNKWMPSANTTRRAFLGGGAAVISLPFLKSISARATPGSSPVRLVFWYAPDGIVMNQYRPAGDGPLPGTLPRLLQPLASVQSELLVLSGFRNDAAMVPVAGDHARGTGSFLTCETVALSTVSIQNGISADQVAADAIGDQTPFRSLELGTTGGSSVGDCDSGYSCAYTRNISWRDAETPNPKLTDPGLVFDRMFAGFDDQLTTEDLERRKRWRASVLDTVTAEATALHARLAPSDQAKLDQYLTGVRELEVRIQNEGLGQVCVPGERPESAGLSYPALCRAMSDLTVLALQCDLTRVVTFMLENGGSNRSFDFLGIPDGHHDLSHHQDDAAKIEKLAQIGTWEIGEFAYLLDRLKNEQDGAGNPLLDHTLCFFSSEISDGNWHNHDDLPVLLAGRGGGYIQNPGRHATFDDVPIADLYLTMLDAAGVRPGGFGADGSRILDLG